MLRGQGAGNAPATSGEPGLSPALRAAAEAKGKMVGQLIGAFGFPGHVDIFLAGREVDLKQPTFAGARITDVVETPLKTFYQLLLSDGTVAWVDPAQIVALHRVK
jgi:hypothetical protein